MECENIVTQLSSIIQSKSTPLHQQAEVILRSLLECNEKVPTQNLPTYLFASLFAWLRKSLTLFTSNPEKTPQLESGIFLFNILLPKIPLNIIQAKYREIFDLIQRLSQIFCKSEVVVRYSIAILIEILQISPKVDWQGEDGHPKLIVNILMSSIIDGNSQTRRQIIKSFNILLSRDDIAQKLSLYLRDFTLKSLENEGREALLMTYFLNPMLPKLQTPIIGDIVYCYLKLLSKSTDEELMTHVYLTLETLMLKNPVTTELSESLLKELLHNQPSFYSDEKLVFAYIQCLSQTLLHMISYDYIVAIRYISSVLSTISEVLLVEKTHFSDFGQKTIELVLLKGIRSELWVRLPRNSEIIDFDEMDLGDQTSKKASDFQKIISILGHLLTSRFSQKIANSLKIVATFFETLESGDSCFGYLKGLIIQVIDLRKEVPFEAFRTCFEKIINKIGLERILELIPLTLEGDPLHDSFEETTNVWILSFLTHSLKFEALDLFFKYFMTLINEIKIKIKGSDSMRVSIFQSLRSQIWEIFPVFSLDLNFLESQISTILDLMNETLELNDSIALNSIMKFLITRDNIILTIKAKNINNISQKAETIIPRLVKLVTMPHLSDTSRLSLKVIGILGRFCSQAYLDRVYKKNGMKLLEEATILDLKTFDILISIQPNVDIRSDKLELSLKLIKKYLLVKNHMQKRAYKLLIKTFEKVHQSFYPELVELLISTQNNEIQPWTKSARLSAIQKVFPLQSSPDSLGLFLQNFLSEVILGLKESNRRCRKLSERFLYQIGEKMKDLGLLKEFLSMMTAGFAGVNGTIKASSILAFGKMFEKYHQEVEKDYIKEIGSLICLLIKEKNKEIFLASLEFFKILMKSLSKEEMQDQLQEILVSLLENDPENREVFRTPINHFLRKLIKKFGKDFVDQIMPENHSKLVKGVIKSQKTEKKRIKKAKKKARQYQKDKTKVKKDEIELEGLETGETEAFELKEKKKRLIEENPNDLLLKYDAESEKFHFIEHPLAKMKEKLKKDEEKKRQLELEILKGKIVVHEFKEETGKKRRREDQYEDNEEKHDNKNKNSVIKGAHIIKESGETFKPKGAMTKGDLMLPGKPNPYAFIQLNPKVLNKRHRNAAGKAFDMVLGKKKEEGLLKGLKSSKKVKIN